MEPKEKIIFHHINAIEWVQSLEDLSDQEWRTPISKNKWSVAEIIGHFYPWDDFVLNERIPYLFTEHELSPFGQDAKEVNHRAAIESRNTTKEQIINRFILSRSQIINALKNIEDELWLKEISIRTKKLTIYEYLKGLVKHDEHHFAQIKEFLKKES